MKLDYFLYSCFEFEQTCKASPQRSLGEERWPLIAASLETQDGLMEKLGSVTDQIKACAKWYGEVFPQILNEQKIEMNNIAAITPAVVFFCLDLKLIFKQPDFGVTPLSYDPNNPRKDHQWDMLEKLIRAAFPNFHLQVLSYLKWICTESETKQWEIGSRPPVGRYAPNMRRPRQGAGPASGRKPLTGKRGKFQDGGGTQGKSPASARSKGGAKFPDKSQEERKEKQALHLVESAIKEMQANLELNEIQLPPANSFYRRLQHKHVMTMGFFSESIGEGRDRAVVILRNSGQ